MFCAKENGALDEKAALRQRRADRERGGRFFPEKGRS
jgi:hypothetical protein